MRKKRFEKGEEYYFIDMTMQINCGCEFRSGFESELFNVGNYFATKEEAEVMARKIKAVFAGADVIHLPSEEESLEAMPQNMSVGQRVGWSSCYYWLKSKIIK